MLLVNNLSIERKGQLLVNNTSFSVPEGSITALIGESGSGKTMTARAVLGMLPRGIKSWGSISFNGIDLVKCSEKEKNSLRRTHFFTILQDSANSLNPTVILSKQMYELTGRRMKDTFREFIIKIKEILISIDLSDNVLSLYPFQLSGGMLQRCMMACALYVKPKLLIADEPTSSLDLIVQKEIVELLNKLSYENNTTILLISHDLDMVSKLSDNVLVQHKGKVIEENNIENILACPTHPYTKKLVETRF